MIERAGLKPKHQVPGLKEPLQYCPAPKRTVFHSPGGKGTCRKEGLVYKGTCLTCKELGPSSEVDTEERVRRGLKSIYWARVGSMGTQKDVKT